MIYLNGIVFVLAHISFIFVLGCVWYSMSFLINDWLSEDLKIIKRLAFKAVLTAIAVIIMTCAVVGVTKQLVSIYNC